MSVVYTHKAVRYCVLGWYLFLTIILFLYLGQLYMIIYTSILSCEELLKTTLCSSTLKITAHRCYIFLFAIQYWNSSKENAACGRLPSSVQVYRNYCESRLKRKKKRAIIEMDVRYKCSVFSLYVGRYLITSILQRIWCSNHVGTYYIYTATRQTIRITKRSAWYLPFYHK